MFFHQFFKILNNSDILYPVNIYFFIETHIYLPDRIGAVVSDVKETMKKEISRIAGFKKKFNTSDIINQRCILDIITIKNGAVKATGLRNLFDMKNISLS